MRWIGYAGRGTGSPGQVTLSCTQHSHLLPTSAGLQQHVHRACLLSKAGPRHISWTCHADGPAGVQTCPPDEHITELLARPLTFTLSIIL